MDYKPETFQLGSIVRPKGPMPDDFQSLGKAGMQRYVVAVKANGGTWPLTFYNAIQDARKKYDLGTHEMCQQKRKDGWIVLYLIPRITIRAPKARYFVWAWGTEG